MRIFFFLSVYYLQIFGMKDSRPYQFSYTSSSETSSEHCPLALALSLEKTREKIESKGWLKITFVKSPNERLLFHQPFSAEVYTHKGMFIACAGFVTGRHQESVARLAQALSRSNELAKHADFFEKSFNSKRFAHIKRLLIRRATKDFITKHPEFLGQAIRCRTTIVLAKKSPGGRMIRYPQEKEGWKYGLCFTTEQESIFKELCHLTHKKKLSNGKKKIGRSDLLKRQAKAADGFYGNFDPESLSPRALVPVLVQLSNKKIDQNFKKKETFIPFSHNVPDSDSVPHSLASISPGLTSTRTRASNSPRLARKADI